MRKTLVLLLLSCPAMDAKERTFEITYTAALDTPEGSTRVQLWIPYPTRGDYQDVRLVSIQAPVPTKVYQEYTYRNSMLFLSAPAAELEQIRVEMTFRVTRREHIEDEFAELEDPEGYIDSPARQWLRPDGNEPVDEAARDRAEQLVSGHSTVVDKARAIYDYTVGDVANGSDFTMLARATGIPVRVAIGFRIPPERGEGEIEEHRRWFEFFVPGFGWVPIDPLEASRDPERREYYFGAHDENRVEFTIGRDIDLNPKQAGAPLGSFIYPYAEIDGKPVRDVRREFFFKDLELVAN